MEQPKAPSHQKSPRDGFAMKKVVPSPGGTTTRKVPVDGRAEDIRGDPRVKKAVYGVLDVHFNDGNHVMSDDEMTEEEDGEEEREKVGKREIRIERYNLKFLQPTAGIFLDSRNMAMRDAREDVREVLRGFYTEYMGQQPAKYTEANKEATVEKFMRTKVATWVKDRRRESKKHFNKKNVAFENAKSGRKTNHQTDIICGPSTSNIARLLNTGVGPAEDRAWTGGQPTEAAQRYQKKRREQEALREEEMARSIDRAMRDGKKVEYYDSEDYMDPEESDDGAGPSDWDEDLPEGVEDLSNNRGVQGAKGAKPKAKRTRRQL